MKKDSKRKEMKSTD